MDKISTIILAGSLIIIMLGMGLSLVMDDFKRIGEAYGDSYSDQLLQEASQRFRRSTRETDLIARTGVDVFSILLEDLSAATGAEVVAEKILYETLRPYQRSSGEEIKLACTIGVVYFYRDDKAIDGAQVMARADKAMARAKRAGKGVFRRFDPVIDGDDTPPEVE